MILRPPTFNPAIFRHGIRGRIITTGEELPSLDLAFAADRTLTARRGPTPTFSRASAATFIGSNGLIQSAAINAPRFDHDPVTLASRGLLIEEQRTNSVRHSENFTNPAWTTFGSSVSAIASTNPAGGSTSHRLAETATNVEHGIFINDSTSGTVTLSVFVKQNGRRFCYLRRDGTGNAVFDLTLGIVTQVTGGGNASITSFGNGWWRISFTTTEIGNWVIKLSNVGTGVDNNSAYLGDGVSGILIYGAQLEVGSFPTSYIPTTTASVIRSADVCSIAGANFTSFYNNAACTVAAIFTPATIAALVSVCGTNDPRDLEIQMTGGGSIAGLSVNTTGATVQLSRSSVTAGVTQSFAFASESNNQAVCLNGGAIASSPTWVKSALQPTLFHIGRAGFGGQFSGHLNRIRVFRRRLTNAQIQSLTA